jgi:hypothetical protein
MPKLKSGDVAEPKLLGEECWITLSDGSSIRVDYPTRGQRRRYDELAMRWHYDMVPAGTDHHIGYFLRCAIREVKGWQLDDKDVQIEFEYGLAKNLKAGDASVDLLDYIEAAGMRLEVEDAVICRLDFTGLDKKKLKSAGLSSATSGSGEPESRSSQGSESSTGGDPLTPVPAERTS